MKVFLRAFNTSDADKIYVWLLDKRNQAFTGGSSFFASKDYVQKWIAEKIFDKNSFYFAICSTETQEIVGYCSLNDVDYRNRKIMGGGIILGAKEYCNTGSAVEATKLAIGFAFEELNMNLVYTYVLEEHLASIRMLEKAGFKKTGVWPQSVYKGGKYHNQIIYCILKEEFEPLPPEIKNTRSKKKIE